MTGRKRPTEFDAVNWPKHYNIHPSGVECIQVVEWMNFNLGNAFKYVFRAGVKGDLLQDYEKAYWYLKREIDRDIEEYETPQAPILTIQTLMDMIVTKEPDDWKKILFRKIWEGFYGNDKNELIEASWILDKVIKGLKHSAEIK